MLAGEDADSNSFERKDEIRQRLRVILRQTTPKQKSRLLYGLVGLPKKGFHCRTRDELQRLDSFLRQHFPSELNLGTSISAYDMEAKLQQLDGGKPSESLPSHGKRDTRPRSDSMGHGSGSTAYSVASTAFSSTSSSDIDDDEEDEDIVVVRPRAHLKRKVSEPISPKPSPESSSSPPSGSKRRGTSFETLCLEASALDAPYSSPLRSHGPSVLRHTPRVLQTSPHFPQVFTFPSSYSSGSSEPWHPGFLTLSAMAVADPPCDSDVKAAIALLNMSKPADAVEIASMPLSLCS